MTIDRSRPSLSAARDDAFTRTIRLRAGYRDDTEFVATASPALSWQVDSSRPSWLQVAAEIELRRGGSTEQFRISARSSTHVAWPFEPLRPRERVFVRVRAQGNDNRWSEWSPPLAVRFGGLMNDELRDGFVSAGSSPDAVALLRTEFDVGVEVASAVLYRTSLGVHRALLNGHPVDDQLLDSGWTSYDDRLVHETTDVTGDLVVGRNALGIELAGCWFTERYGWTEDVAERYYDGPTSVSCLLVIDYADGRRQEVQSGDDWLATEDGPVRSSGLYAGEVHDARAQRLGWASAHFDSGEWHPVARREWRARIVPRSAPPVRRTQELPVAEVIVTPGGATILDFGQNVVGWVRFAVTGSPDQQVVLRHAEVMEHGELGVRPLRRARATDRFTLAGTGEETCEPRFTFHGFRFVEVSGWNGPLDPDAFRAIVIGSDLRRTGYFSTSDPLLNRLHENVVWGMRGNFISIPTDCPQRDERMGWTGDIQVFSPTASFLYDVDGFLDSWLEDLRGEQARAGGVPPYVVPNVFGATTPAAAWGDATCIVPMVLYERYGDVDVLRRHLPAMRDWCDLLVAQTSGTYIRTDDRQWGDWLDPDAPPQAPARAKTDFDIVASAYLCRSLEFTAAALRAVGDEREADRYLTMWQDARDAFGAEFITPKARMVSDAPTAYALAIRFGLVRDPEVLIALGARLAELCRRSGYTIRTGFVGTPLLLDALADTGQGHIALRMLRQTRSPGWLYAVNLGATTIWERWDSMLEDGSINPGEMTSFNHYAFGAVADFLHRRVAGIAVGAPGGANLRFAPLVIDGLDSAEASWDSPFGVGSIAWNRAGSTLTVTVTVPPNATGSVRLPWAPDREVAVGSGRHEWKGDVAPGPVTSGPLGLGASLADVIDDEARFTALLALLRSQFPQRYADIVAYGDWSSGFTVNQMIERYQLYPAVEDIVALLKDPGDAA